MATVVPKLLNTVGSDAAYFGEKDAQQLAVVRRLVADLDIPCAIEACPTVRELDRDALAVVAARLGAVRLIDNLAIPLPRR